MREVGTWGNLWSSPGCLSTGRVGNMPTRGDSRDSLAQDVRAQVNWREQSYGGRGSSSHRLDMGQWGGGEISTKKVNIFSIFTVFLPSERVYIWKEKKNSNKPCGIGLKL